MHRGIILILFSPYQCELCLEFLLIHIKLVARVYVKAIVSSNAIAYQGKVFM